MMFSWGVKGKQVKMKQGKKQNEWHFIAILDENERTIRAQCWHVAETE